MDLQQAYTHLYTTVLAEHAEVFRQQNLDEIEIFMDMIIKAKRLFVMGAGREGIAARSFAMRLMHLGKEVHWIWDDTTPGMHEGDLFIIVNGSGEIGHISYTADQAANTGAKIAVITGAPAGGCPAKADFSLFVPAAVYKGNDPRTVPSIQPMGNLFEQHLFLLFDIIVILLEKELNLTHEEMESRHRNIE